MPRKKKEKALVRIADIPITDKDVKRTIDITVKGTLVIGKLLVKGIKKTNEYIGEKRTEKRFHDSGYELTELSDKKYDFVEEENERKKKKGS